MTEQPDHATSVGQTGGLPGRNAAPEASIVPDDQLADTVAMGEVAGTSSPEPGAADGDEG